MNSLLKKNPLVFTLIIIAVVLFWVSSNRFWGDNRWNNLLVSDGPGYYAYLPAVVVYNDLSFGFFDRVQQGVNRENFKYDYRIKTSKGVIDKYFAGTALVQLPFYITGHLITRLTSGLMDGYSKWYLIFFHVGALFYCLFGLFLFWKIMRMYHLPDELSAFLMLAVIFGTNLYHYTVNEPGMSHVYSYTFINLFVYQSLLFLKKGNNQHFLLAMLSLGIITLIRPVNIMVLLSIPFLSGSFTLFKKRITILFTRPLTLISGVLLFMMVVSIQLLIYKIETGNFMVYSYGNEGINLLKPHFIDFLFSYKKGFFIYTPIALLSVIASVFVWGKDRFLLYSWLIFLFVVTYVLSSWWMWYYGGSFSSRVMVEYLIFFFIPLGLWLSKVKYHKLLITVVILLMMINMVQTFQYQYGYIHWSEMNKERYWNNFLRIDKVLKHQRDW